MCTSLPVFLVFGRKATFGVEVDRAVECDGHVEPPCNGRKMMDIVYYNATREFRRNCCDLVRKIPASAWRSSGLRQTMLLASIDENKKRTWIVRQKWRFTIASEACRSTAISGRFWKCPLDFSHLFWERQAISHCRGPLFLSYWRQDKSSSHTDQASGRH